MLPIDPFYFSLYYVFNGIGLIPGRLVPLGIPWKLLILNIAAWRHSVNASFKVSYSYKSRKIMKAVCGVFSRSRNHPTTKTMLQTHVFSLFSTNSFIEWALLEAVIIWQSISLGLWMIQDGEYPVGADTRSDDLDFGQECICSSWSKSLCSKSQTMKDGIGSVPGQLISWKIPNTGWDHVKTDGVWRVEYLDGWIWKHFAGWYTHVAGAVEILEHGLNPLSESNYCRKITVQ